MTPVTDQMAAELCGSMGLAPDSIARQALAGHHTVFESAAEMDANGRAISTFDLGGEGGFLLQAISVNAPTPSTANPTFQIIDTGRNRQLFSRYVHQRLFYQRGEFAISIGEKGVGGNCVGRLPKPYYFRPGSQIVVQVRVEDAPGDYAASVYLHGYRFRGGLGGPALPDPRHESRTIRVVAPAGVGNMLIEEGQRFHLTQIVALPTPGASFANDERVQITDTRLNRKLFSDPMPLQMFAAPVGPYYRLHHPYTFEPMTQIKVDLAGVAFDPDTAPETSGLYLVGWREWLR